MKASVIERLTDEERASILADADAALDGRPSSHSKIFVSWRGYHVYAERTNHGIRVTNRAGTEVCHSTLLRAPNFLDVM